MKKIILLAAVLLLISLNIDKTSAQNLNKTDYKRAVSFMWENLNNKKVFNLHISPHWFENNKGLWFVIHNKEGKKYKKVMFNKMKIEDLFDHEQTAKALSKITGKKIDAKDLPISKADFSKSKTLKITSDRIEYILYLKSYQIEKVKEEKKKKNPHEFVSPDGNWTAFTKDYNIYLRSKDGKEYQISKSGKKNYEFGSYYGWYDLSDGENGDRPRRTWINWSADSKWIQTSICDLRTADKMYLLNWSIDSLYKPKLLSYYRGSPGDTTMVHMIPVFINVEEKELIVPNLPRNTHINSLAFSWSEELDMVCYASYSERGFKKFHVLKYDLEEDRITRLFTEESKTNVDNFDYMIYEKEDLIIFYSERSGWRQLHSYNLETGEIQQITSGGYFVHKIELVDPVSNTLYFTASGKEKSNNPYHKYFYSVNIFDKQEKLLTPEGHHHEVNVPENANYFTDNCSDANTPTKTYLRDLKTGKIILTLGKTNADYLAGTGWNAPQVFEFTGRDEKTTLYGALWKPSNFDPSKKYPIIDHSYTGPHTQMFPKTFRRTLSINNQALSELGFIVMMVDGMGTYGRSKEFHNMSYRNMGENLKDHVLAIEYLAKTYSWIDGDKVGIFGRSAGGYDACHAMLEYPDVFKVSVSNAADHDFRMEKAWWPEMYMGWPVDSLYDQVSNITMAKNLKGKLLICHGGIDNNVNPSATFKLAEALIKADKEFDMLIFPSQSHRYYNNYNYYFTKKRWNYFVEHLSDKEPIWDFDFK